MHISYSRVNTYLSCPYKHYLCYEEGIVKKKKDRPLYFGTDFHKLLEYRNKSDDEKSKAMQEIIDTYYSLPADQQSDLGADYPETLFTIFNDYCDVWKDAPLPNETEVEFNIKMGNFKGEPIYFKGFIDELYFNDDGITVGEHKTFTKMPNKDFLVMNTQKSLYAVAVKKMYGKFPETIMWDYIHSQAASYPVWLDKSNKFSTAANNKITPASYKRACKERGIEPKEEDIEKYANNISNFFFRTEMDYIPEMIKNVWEGFKYTSKDIVQHGKLNKTKNLTYNCGWCQYRDICHAELTASPVEEIIERDFMVKEEVNECIEQSETD
jgi:hypothetical protein